MHLRILNNRMAEAYKRIVSSVKILAAKFDLDGNAVQKANHREPLVKRLLQLEAIADFLDALVSSTVSGVSDNNTTVEDILNRIDEIEGIGPSTMEKIREGLSE